MIQYDVDHYVITIWHCSIPVNLLVDEVAADLFVEHRSILGGTIPGSVIGPNS